MNPEPKTRHMFLQELHKLSNFSRYNETERKAIKAIIIQEELINACLSGKKESLERVEACNPEFNRKNLAVGDIYKLLDTIEATRLSNAITTLGFVIDCKGSRNLSTLEAIAKYVEITDLIADEKEQLSNFESLVGEAVYYLQSQEFVSSPGKRGPHGG